MKLKAFFIWMCCFCSPAFAEAQQIISEEDVKNSIKSDEFIMTKASEDIAGNISLWVTLRKSLSGVSRLGWEIQLGDKIPSQPVAVIEVLSFLNEEEITHICPRPFMEGSEHYQMEQWMNRAIANLDSFTMKDPQKEIIRIKCLENIRQALSEKDKWQ